MKRFMKHSLREKLIIILNYIVGFIMIFTASLEGDAYVVERCVVIAFCILWFVLFVIANPRYLKDDFWR